MARPLLQKILEGERAQRSEVQRKLREVEKALAALKAPEWWPGHITRCVPDSLLGRSLSCVADLFVNFGGCISALQHCQDLPLCVTLQALPFALQPQQRQRGEAAGPQGPAAAAARGAQPAL